MSKIADRATRPVSLAEFRDTGSPEHICRLDLDPPSDPQYVLRMVLCADGSPRPSLPQDLAWVAPMLNIAAQDQYELEINHPFVYLTVRHGPVRTQTDDEWHVDGFSTRIAHLPEQNYIWCSRLGTEYSPLRVEFPPDFDPTRHNVNSFLAQHIDYSRTWVCESRAVYCIDPYILHRRRPETAGETRTFVRISFVPIEINDLNNTPNPLLPRTCTRDGVAFRNTLVDYPET